MAASPGDDDERSCAGAASTSSLGAAAAGLDVASASVAKAAVDCAAPEKKSDDLLDAIKKLKEEQNAVRSERKRIKKDLKNAERRRSRLRKKAKQLSDNDLMDVLKMRGFNEPAPNGPSR